MPDESTQSIVIDADPAQIMAVIADFANYPAWAGSVKKAEVLEAGPDGRARRVAFSLDAGIVRDQYELAYVWTGDEKVEWTLVSGPDDAGPARLLHAASRTVPAAPTSPTRSRSTWSSRCSGLLKRKAERVVMDTALKELKKRVEGLRV